MEPAGRVIVFWIWTNGIMKLFVSFFANKTELQKIAIPRGLRRWRYTLDFIITSALAWLGFVWLPAVYFISSLLFSSAISAKTETGVTP